MNEEELAKIEETKTDSTEKKDSTEKTESGTTNESDTDKKKEDPKPTTSTEGAGEVIKPFKGN